MKKDIYFDIDYANLYRDPNYDEVKMYYYETTKGIVIYTYLLRKIEILHDIYFDIITPYGYGGPLFMPKKKDELEELALDFRKEFDEFCKKERIVSEFVRFHPLEKNYKFMEDKMELIYLSDTIYMNLEDEEQILNEMDGKARNMIRKSIKNGVVVKEETDKNSIERFIKIYYETMSKNSASAEYFFSEEYFKKMFELGPNNIRLFNAYFENEIISSSSILLGDRFIHYHLSANTSKGYKLAANNLLLFEIAKWGAENRYEKFHLGGGYGGNNSPLFKFKKAMGKNNVSKFYIGKKIHDKEVYDLMVKKQEEKNPEIKGENENFFPLYRRT